VNDFDGFYVPLLVKASSRGISGSNLQHQRWQLATSNQQPATCNTKRPTAISNGQRAFTAL